MKKASEPNEDQESDVKIDISHTDIPELDGNVETFNRYASASTISLSLLTARAASQRNGKRTIKRFGRL